MDYFRGIGESDETSYKLICVWYEGTGSFFYLCLVLLSHVYPNIVYPAVSIAIS